MRRFRIENSPAKHFAERGSTGSGNGFVLARRLPGRGGAPQLPDQVGPIGGADRVTRLQFVERIAVHLQKAHDRSPVVDVHLRQIAPPAFRVFDLIPATVAGGFDHQSVGGRRLTGFVDETRKAPAEDFLLLDDAHRRAAKARK